MDDWSSVRLCDVANLILSGVLFFSPWLFDLSTGAQWQTASVVGIIIAVLSIAALAAFAVWEEWFNLIAGLALIVSPWLLGFQDSDAMTIDVAIGVIVAALGGVRSLADARSRRPGSPQATEPAIPIEECNKKGDSCPPFAGGSAGRVLQPLGGGSPVVVPIRRRGRICRILGDALVAHGGRDSGNPDLPIAWPSPAFSLELACAVLGL